MLCICFVAVFVLHVYLRFSLSFLLSFRFYTLLTSQSSCLTKKMDRLSVYFRNIYLILFLNFIHLAPTLKSIFYYSENNLSWLFQFVWILPNSLCLSIPLVESIDASNYHLSIIFKTAGQLKVPQFLFINIIILVR